MLTTLFTIFLDLLYFDLKELLSKIFQEYKYFLSIKKNATLLIFLKLLYLKKKTFEELF